MSHIHYLNYPTVRPIPWTGWTVLGIPHIHYCPFHPSVPWTGWTVLRYHIHCLIPLSVPSLSPMDRVDSARDTPSVPHTLLFVPSLSPMDWVDSTRDTQVLTLNYPTVCQSIVCPIMERCVSHTLSVLYRGEASTKGKIQMYDNSFGSSSHNEITKRKLARTLLSTCSCYCIYM